MSTLRVRYARDEQEGPESRERGVAAHQDADVIDLVADEASAKRVIENYIAIRAVLSEAQNAAVRLLSGDAYCESARNLGLLDGHTIIADGESDFVPVLDFAVYNYTGGGQTAVARYWKTHRPKPGSIEDEVRDMMLNSSYHVLEVTHVNKGLGFEARDVVIEDEFFVLDLGFGQTLKPGSVRATRLLHTEGYSMTTGAAIPFEAEAVGDVISDVVESVHIGSGRRRSQGSPNHEEFVAAVIRASLAHRGDIGVSYLDPTDSLKLKDGVGRELPAGSQSWSEYDEDTAPVLHSSRIRRNGPCPCGSGHKYKKCCGRGK